MAERTEWTGTASDLLGALAEEAGERVAKAKTWPGLILGGSFKYPLENSYNANYH